VLAFALLVSYPPENAGVGPWQCSCSYHGENESEAIVTNLHVDNVGEMAVVECEGRFVRSDEAFRLRDVVTAQRDAHIIVLDLTEMRALGGGGIGVMVFLQRWCRDRDIRFKLFNPSRSVEERLENTNAMSEFDIASLDEMMALLGQADQRYALAA
jgi:anti-anti-sigma regulatory factor